MELGRPPWLIAAGLALALLPGTQTQQTTLGGCTCRRSWAAPNQSCLDSTTLHHDCGMRAPCDGNTGGVCGQSWCIVENTTTCRPFCDGQSGCNRDFCTPPPEPAPSTERDLLLQRPVYMVNGFLPRPVGTGIRDCSQQGPRSPLVSANLADCIEACKLNVGCNSLVVDVALNPSAGGARSYNCSQQSCTDDVVPTPGASMLTNNRFYIRVEYQTECCHGHRPQHAQRTSCHFPFIVDDRLYTSCATLPGLGERQICATRTDRQHHMVEWGVCECESTSNATASPTAPPTRLPSAFSTSTSASSSSTASLPTSPPPTQSPSRSPTHRPHAVSTRPPTARPTRSGTPPGPAANSKSDDNKSIDKLLVTLIMVAIVGCVLATLLMSLVAIKQCRRWRDRRAFVDMEMRAVAAGKVGRQRQGRLKPGQQQRQQRPPQRQRPQPQPQPQPQGQRGSPDGFRRVRAQTEHADFTLAQQQHRFHEYETTMANLGFPNTDGKTLRDVLHGSTGDAGVVTVGGFSRTRSRSELPAGSNGQFSRGRSMTARPANGQERSRDWGPATTVRDLVGGNIGGQMQAAPSLGELVRRSLGEVSAGASRRGSQSRSRSQSQSRSRSRSRPTSPGGGTAAATRMAESLMITPLSLSRRSSQDSPATGTSDAEHADADGGGAGRARRSRSLNRGSRRHRAESTTGAGKVGTANYTLDDIRNAVRASSSLATPGQGTSTDTSPAPSSLPSLHGSNRTTPRATPLGTPYGSTIDLTASNGSAEMAGHWRMLRSAVQKGEVQGGDWKGGGGATQGSSLAGTTGGVGAALAEDWSPAAVAAAVASPTYAQKPLLSHSKTSLRDLLELDSSA